MAVYTTYDMVADCRAGKPEGWEFFLIHIVPAIRHFLAHYYPGRAEDKELLNRILLDFRRPDSRSLTQLEPGPERNVLVDVRQAVLAAVERDRLSLKPELTLSLETLAAVCEPFTPLERQVVWFETMRYEAPYTSELLSMKAGTVEKIRERAAALLREKSESWNRTLIRDNGFWLGQEALVAENPRPLTIRQVVDVIDGRATWNDRQEVEYAMKLSWQNVDQICRFREVTQYTRESIALTDEESETCRNLLGIRKQKPGFLNRIFAG